MTSICRRVLPSILATLAAAGCAGDIGREGEAPDDRRGGAGSVGAGGRTGGTQGGPPGTSGGAGSGAPPAAFAPGPGGVYRLTSRQIRNSLRDLFGASAPALPELEPDVRVLGFSTVGAASASISAASTEAFETHATKLGSWAFGTGGALRASVTCAAANGPDEACARTFFTRFGRRLFRRPLAGDDDAAFVLSFRNAGGGWTGLTAALSAMVQSPRFLFRIELGNQQAGAHRRYDGWELASRLSFFLWNSTPDDALLTAAEKGFDDATLRTQALRLLADPRVRDGLGAFFSEKLATDGVDLLAKDQQTFPTFGPTLQAAMKQETERVIADVLFTRDADYLNLLDTRSTFVTRELATLYGIPGVTSATPVAATLPADGLRLGLLGHASFLAANSHPAQTSPTQRGMFVQTKLLCTSIPAPPANVSTELPAPDPNARTVRQRLESHRRDPACGGCHALMDPIGVAFESFDALGTLRMRDGADPIDPSGTFDGKAYADVRGLVDLLRKSPRTSACLVRDLYRYATAHEESTEEEALLNDLFAAFDDGGRRVSQIALALVTNDGFRLAGVTP